MLILNTRNSNIAATEAPAAATAVATAAAAATTTATAEFYLIQRDEDAELPVIKMWP